MGKKWSFFNKKEKEKEVYDKKEYDFFDDDYMSETGRIKLNIYDNDDKTLKESLEETRIIRNNSIDSEEEKISLNIKDDSRDRVVVDETYQEDIRINSDNKLDQDDKDLKFSQEVKIETNEVKDDLPSGAFETTVVSSNEIQEEIAKKSEQEKLDEDLEETRFISLDDQTYEPDDKVEYSQSQEDDDLMDNSGSTMYLTAPIIAQRDLDEDEKEDYREDIVFEKEKKGIFKTILTVLGNIIFILFIALMSLVIILSGLSFFSGKEPTIMGNKMYIIGENSLSPVLNKNDAIVVKEIPAKAAKTGDIVVYYGKNGKDIITSWVDKVNEDSSVEVKKDLSQDKSIKVDEKAIIGVASYRIAKLGYIITFISRPIGIAIVLGVGFVLYFLIWLMGRKRR